MIYQTASISTFRVGQEITYFNSALQCWVTATINSFNVDGSLNLEEPGSCQTYMQVPQVKYFLAFERRNYFTFAASIGALHVWILQIIVRKPAPFPLFVQQTMPTLSSGFQVDTEKNRCTINKYLFIVNDHHSRAADNEC